MAQRDDKLIKKTKSAAPHVRGEKNVNVQYPLYTEEDDTEVVAIGGQKFSFMQEDIAEMKLEMRQLKDLFLYLVQITELAYETETTDVDRSKIEDIENDT